MTGQPDPALAEAARIASAATGAGHVRTGPGGVLRWIAIVLLTLRLLVDLGTATIMAQMSYDISGFLTEAAVLFVAIVILWHRPWRRRAEEQAQPMPMAAPLPAVEIVSERPPAMTVFDRIFIATLAVNLVTLFQAFPLLRRLLATDPAAVQAGLTFEVVFGGLVMSFMAMIVLWFFVSRLRSNVARWILTILCGQVLLQSLVGAQRYMTLSPYYYATSLIAALMGMAAVAVLFRPGPKAWFEPRRYQAHNPHRSPRGARYI